MLRSLSSGVSGLRNHQIRMDVIGNNVANVNTVAFKSGRVTFKEGFAQMMESGSRPSGSLGGTNPVQVGLGSAIGSVDTVFTQGNLESTGQQTDLAIQGSSFFIVGNGNQRYYTRAGNFQLDADGNLVSPANGYKVQGRMAVNGALVDAVTNIQLPFGSKASANPTSRVTVGGNLDGSALVFDKGAAATLDPLDPVQRALPQNLNSFKDMSMTVYDSLGNKHTLKMVTWKTAANEWEWQMDDTGMDITAAGVTEVAGTHPITFLPDGSIDTTAVGYAIPQVKFTPNSGGADVIIDIDLGSGVNGLSQFAGSPNAVFRDQNGYGVGTLESFSIDSAGRVVGAFTNGTSQALAQVALSSFNNSTGLQRIGDNMYAATGNSGEPVVGYAGEGMESSIAAGALEMSNVDLAQEFTSMIVAQRGFQANGRVITTSDQMLEELVQLKR